MNKRTKILSGGLLGAATLAGCFALAQRPGDNSAGGQAGDDTVPRMMEFDANKDGKLTREEVTDERLTRIFDRADANKDGTVTTAELTALVAAEPARRGGPGGFGPGGFGPPPGGGPPGGGFRPGEILPQMFQSRLNLSAEQKAKIEALQKDVDAGLEKILNDDQKRQWKEMRSRGPGGPRGRRGPGGPGGGGPGRPGRPGGGPPGRPE
jgi:EF hand